jgi:GNAT superfamily N-acetyltransferase
MHDLFLDSGVIRKLWIGEADVYRAHLLRLDAASRLSRFGGAVTDDFIRNYVKQMDGLNAVLHGYFVDGVLRGVGELRLFGLPMGATAEAAFSIERPWQSHGVGSVLLERTLLAARNRAIKHLHMVCMNDNQRMQQLARKFEADLSFDFGAVVGEVEAPYPTPLSMWRELVFDGHGLASAMFDAQSRLLRSA